MKLQKQIGKRVGNKEYCKWVVVIPDEIIQKAGFKVGDTLSVKFENNCIVIWKP